MLNFGPQNLGSWGSRPPIPPDPRLVWKLKKNFFGNIPLLF